MNYQKKLFYLPNLTRSNLTSLHIRYLLDSASALTAALKTWHYSHKCFWSRSWIWNFRTDILLMNASHFRDTLEAFLAHGSLPKLPIYSAPYKRGLFWNVELQISKFTFFIWSILFCWLLWGCEDNKLFRTLLRTFQLPTFGCCLTA